MGVAHHCGVAHSMLRWHISGGMAHQWGVAHQWGWHIIEGVAHLWGVAHQWGMASMGGSPKPKVSLLVKPLELQYHISKAAKEKNITQQRDSGLFPCTARPIFLLVLVHYVVSHNSLLRFESAWIQTLHDSKRKRTNSCFHPANMSATCIRIKCLQTTNWN